MLEKVQDGMKCVISRIVPMLFTVSFFLFEPANIYEIYKVTLFAHIVTYMSLPFLRLWAHCLTLYAISACACTLLYFVRMVVFYPIAFNLSHCVYLVYYTIYIGV